MISLAVFGAGSLACSVATGFDGLLAMRLLTGLGLGGAFPNLIALSAEAVSAERRSFAVGTVYAAMPLGGGLAGVLTLVGAAGPADWRSIFLVGGILPLLLLPLVALYLPHDRRDRQPAAVSPGQPSSARSARAALFGRDQVALTINLWCVFFLVVMLLSIIQNWLPLLLVGKGLAGREAAATQIAFNVAGALGATTAGYMIAGTRKALVPIVAFAMLLVATTLVAALSMPGPLIFASLTLGFGMLAVQSILYGLTPSCYAEAIRGTGVGAAVAVGRAGSVLGPLLAAAVIALGFTSSQLLMMLVPIIAAAGVGTLLLTRRIAARS